jgi:hypothetical protein
MRIDIFTASCTAAVFISLVFFAAFPRLAGPRVVMPALTPRTNLDCAELVRLHVHVVGVGDSLTQGAFGSLGSASPYPPSVAARLDGFVRRSAASDRCVAVVSTSSLVLAFPGFTSAQGLQVISSLAPDQIPGNGSLDTSQLWPSWQAAMSEAMLNGATCIVVVVGVLFGANDRFGADFRFAVRDVPSQFPRSFWNRKNGDVLRRATAAPLSNPGGQQHASPPEETIRNVMLVHRRLEKALDMLAAREMRERSHRSKAGQGSNITQDADAVAGPRGLSFHRLVLNLEQLPQVLLLPESSRLALLDKMCGPVNFFNFCRAFCDSVSMAGRENQRRLVAISAGIKAQLEARWEQQLEEAAIRSTVGKTKPVRCDLGVVSVSSGFLNPNLHVPESHEWGINGTRLVRFGDCVHLNAGGYRAWAIAISRSVEDRLAEFFVGQ